MATNHTPTATSNPLAAAATNLSPEDRVLLHLFFHEEAFSLAQIAEHLGLDLLELTARILAEPFQAALAAIEQAAAAIARARRAQAHIARSARGISPALNGICSGPRTPAQLPTGAFGARALCWRPRRPSD
jgi:hypothetical protein